MDLYDGRVFDVFPVGIDPFRDLDRFRSIPEVVSGQNLVLAVFHPKQGEMGWGKIENAGPVFVYHLLRHGPV